jgi:xanthine/CO dehydrogenase XdhC/CoxF family maturation factor
MVVGAERSAPRPLGTKMAINDRGEIAGAVSGGCVEGAVVEIAERVIDSGRPELAGWTSRAPVVIATARISLIAEERPASRGKQDRAWPARERCFETTRRPRRKRIHWATSRTSWPTSPTNSCNLRT